MTIIYHGVCRHWRYDGEQDQNTFSRSFWFDWGRSKINQQPNISYIKIFFFPVFISVQSLSRVWLFATPWTVSCQASLSVTNSQSLLKLMSINSVMPSNHLILCHPLLLPSIFPRIRVISNESVLCIRWPKVHVISSLQFSSVAQPGLTLCNPMDCSRPGLPVHHQCPELAQTHILQVNDAIQLSHPLSFPSPPAFNLSQHQGLFKWVSSLHQVAKVLEFQLQHQSFQ